MDPQDLVDPRRTYRFCQKAGTNISRIPYNSRRPMSMRNDSTHLAASGAAAHENAGPKCPNASPALPSAEHTSPKASVRPSPKHISSIHPASPQKMYSSTKVDTVEMTVGETVWRLIRTDITARGADKGTALMTMAGRLGLDASETMAFGDGGNDKTIIAAAGVGIAMGNATDEVKAVADYVTTSVDDDGIRNALKHFNII